MSTFIRRYAKYLNEKAFSYRQMAFDFCKVKRGYVLADLLPNNLYEKIYRCTFVYESSLHEVRRTCRTSPAKMKNVRRRAPVKFNQMSGEEVKMSGEAQKNFVYTVKETEINFIPGCQVASLMIYIV